MRLDFKTGMKDGLPICLGYFSVSFGVGILAVKAGLSAGIAALISLTNLTSAGELAGIGVIGAMGSYVEMILTQLLINCRYSLMAISLSQKLSKEFNLFHRMCAAYGITDEIFGVAISKKERITPTYMYGMIAVATAGWVAGTYLGAVCGELLPRRITAALGILLYGMFIAIVIPPIKESKANLSIILISVLISCGLYYLAPQISAGFSVIISAVIASVIMAVLVPVRDVREEEE